MVEVSSVATITQKACRKGDFRDVFAPEMTPHGRAWLCWDSRVSERKPYPSDLSGERWALIEPVITAWKAAYPSVSGHQGGYAMREIVNAILCQSRTGCQWDYLSQACRRAARCTTISPGGATWHRSGDPWPAALAGTGETRAVSRPGPGGAGTQGVHAAAGVPSSTTGGDAGRRVPGRKRGLAVDVLGLVVAVVVLAASAHENTAGIALLDRVAAQAGTVRTALVDQGFKNAVAVHGAALRARHSVSVYGTSRLECRSTQ